MLNHTLNMSIVNYKNARKSQFEVAVVSLLLILNRFCKTWTRLFSYFNYNFEHAFAWWISLCPQCCLQSILTDFCETIVLRIEAIAWRCSVSDLPQISLLMLSKFKSFKKLSLNISQKSQENNYNGNLSLKKLQAFQYLVKTSYLKNNP